MGTEFLDIWLVVGAGAFLFALLFELQRRPPPVDVSPAAHRPAETVMRRRRCLLLALLATVEAAGILVSRLMTVRTHAIATRTADMDAAIARWDTAFGPCLLVAVLGCGVFLFAVSADFVNRHRPFEPEDGVDIMRDGFGLFLSGALSLVLVFAWMIDQG